MTKRFNHFTDQIFYGNGSCNCSNAQQVRIYQLLHEALSLVSGVQQYSPGREECEDWDVDRDVRDIQDKAAEIYLALTGVRPRLPKKKESDQIEPFWAVFCHTVDLDDPEEYGEDEDAVMEMVWVGKKWKPVKDDPMTLYDKMERFFTEKAALLKAVKLGECGREVHVWKWTGKKWELVTNG